MVQTINLGIENLVSAQAQKHVTVNEAFARIDAATQLAVLDRDLIDPPATPLDGGRYLLPTGATGAWSGHDDEIAVWEETTLGWLFLTPRPGWRVWLLDEETLMILTGAGWQEVGGGAASVNPVSGSLLGVNTTADTINRIAVKTDAALFSHDDVTPGSGDMRFTLNKAAAGNDTSLTLQTGYSARAQVGLTGDDDLHLKVSADGTTFRNGVHIEGATGNVSLGSIVDHTGTVTIRGATGTTLKLMTDAEDECILGFYDTQAAVSQQYEIVYDAAGENDVDWRWGGVTVNTFHRTGNAQFGGCLAVGHLQDVYLNNGSLVSFDTDGTFNPDRATAGNVDHLYHDDSSNTWHFCSDAAYRSTGNSTLRAASFTTTSDYRRKKYIADVDGREQLDLIARMRPVSFAWRGSSAPKEVGFIAHELQEHVPYAVQGEKDQKDGEGNDAYQGVDAAKLVPILIAAVQTLDTRIKAIESTLPVMAA